MSLLSNCTKCVNLKNFESGKQFSQYSKLENFIIWNSGKMHFPCGKPNWKQSIPIIHIIVFSNKWKCCCEEKSRHVWIKEQQKNHLLRMKNRGMKTSFYPDNDNLSHHIFLDSGLVSFVQWMFIAFRVCGSVVSL